MIAGCDVSGWNRKSRAVRRELLRTIPRAVQEISDDVHRRTVKNLSGGVYLRGILPVRRVTGTLARSIQRANVSFGLIAVFANERIAHYAKYVHNGTRFMPPRRFLGDVITERRHWGHWKLKDSIIKAIRKVGR